VNFFLVGLPVDVVLSAEPCKYLSLACGCVFFVEVICNSITNGGSSPQQGHH
jgi:hypothetical protein